MENFKSYLSKVGIVPNNINNVWETKFYYCVNVQQCPSFYLAYFSRYEQVNGSGEVILMLSKSDLNNPTITLNLFPL